MLSMPSMGQIRVTAVPRQTTRPRCRVSWVSLYGSSGSLRYSMVSSRTMLSRGSNPLRVPLDSRPPANLTRICLSMNLSGRFHTGQIVNKIYLLRSRIDSFFFLSPPSAVLLGADIFLSYFLKLMESQLRSNVSLFILIFQSRISFPLGAPSHH